MRQEIQEQPAVLARLLSSARPAVERVARLVRERSPAAVVMVARGSSAHAALYGKYLFETMAALPTALAAPSVATLYGRSPRLARTLVVGVSQSGASPDVVEVVRRARADGALTVAITNEPAAPLAGVAEHVLPLDAGVERSVAATKTCTAAMALLALLVGAASRRAGLVRGVDRLPEAVAGALSCAGAMQAVAERWRDVDRCLVLGRGYNLATAREAALKLVETSRVLAAAYSAAELLHGPAALLDERIPTLLFAARGPAVPTLGPIVRRCTRAGAEVVAVGDASEVLGQSTTPVVVDLPVPEALTPIPLAIPAQWLAYFLARARDLDPDRPPGLRKITRTR
ncbi:MAG TPA: SIS domain-containing protein [Chloroflexota bacterium]